MEKVKKGTLSGGRESETYVAENLTMIMCANELDEEKKSERKCGERGRFFVLSKNYLLRGKKICNGYCTGDAGLKHEQHPSPFIIGATFTS